MISTSEVTVALRKRPCRICRRWFMPSKFQGERQKVCSKPEFQDERHRRSDREWHARNPDYDKKRYLKKRARLEAPEEPVEDPLARIDWEVLERAIGPKHRAALEGVGRLLQHHVQDAAISRVQEVSRKFDQQLNMRLQDTAPATSGVSTAQSARLPPDGPKTQPAARGRSP